MQANIGDTVKVHYTGTLSNGEIFDSSKQREPLKFKLGAGNVIAGFDNAVCGMIVGQTKTVLIPYQEAYGEQLPELIQVLDKKLFPKDMDLAEGMELYGKNKNGHSMNFTITKIDHDMITIDANHSLAGKDLTFELNLVEIKKP